RQARVDRGEDVIVGVNKYRSGEAAPVDILDVDNEAVRKAQIERLARVRQFRDAGRCAAALAALTEAARSGNGNLLELAIAASRARATVGEISDALETVFTRHRAATRAVSGVYGGQYRDDEEFRRIQREIDGFAREEGRRPRMLVVKLGQDGLDVDIGPLFQTPEEAARQAVENDVHIVGVSSQAAAHKTLVPALIAALRAEGAGDVIVVCGGVIPPQDHEFLKAAGVAAIYGPGTNIPLAAAEILSLIRTQRLAA